MRVLYIGAFSGRPAEGMRGVGRAIVERMALRHETMCLDTRAAVTLPGIHHARRFAPDVIHYLAGPTIRSAGILAFYSVLLPRAARVVSAIRPFLGRPGRSVITRFRPHVILTQDPYWERLFERTGIPVLYVPNGVDTDRFQPAVGAERLVKRQVLGIVSSKPVVLHVGHLKENRNLSVVADLQAQGAFQTVVVSSSETAADPLVRAELLSAGCHVIEGFREDLPEIYRCADAYLFPVVPPPQGKLPASYDQIGVIDMPLSVLEAMATDLPILSTRHRALNRQFVEDGAFLWFDGTPHHAAGQLRRLGKSHGANRRKALELAWDLVVPKIDHAYARVLAGCACAPLLKNVGH